MEHINDKAEQAEKDCLVKKKRPQEDPTNTEFMILEKLFLALFTKKLMSAVQQVCSFVAPTKTIFKVLVLKMALHTTSTC
eukprot:m51a1_g9174 hypothetical protein (80) ;mRNA; f:43782-44160